MINLKQISESLEKNTEHIAKKAKGDESMKAVVPDFPPYDNVLFGCLLSIPEVLKDPGYANIRIQDLEIEARIGMFTTGNKRLFPRCPKRIAYGMDPDIRRDVERSLDPFFRTKFHAGMDESFAKRLKTKFMKKDLFSAEVLPKQIQYVDDEGNRFTKDPQNGEFHHEMKKKLKVYDISLLAHDYDMRIACATEFQSNSTAATLPNASSSRNHGIAATFTERHKYRTCYQLLKNPKWRIDFTEVVMQTSSSSVKEGANVTSSSSSSSSSSSPREYELEFEIKADFLLKWLTTPPPQQQQLTHELCSELKFLLDYCIPSQTDTHGEVELTPCELPLMTALSSPLIEINRIAKPTTSTTSMEFLGSMPINLFRSSWSNVLQSDYFLTEKTDGVRYLLYIVAHPLKPGKSLAVFMNRSKELFIYPQSELLGHCFPINTILDGEIVYNHHYKKSIFLLFDVLVYADQSYIHYSFAERYQFIKETIMSHYHQEIKRQQLPNTSSSQQQLLVHYKKFVSKEKLSELLKSFQIEHGERIYHENELRYHKTDGIIFQPNTPYHFSKYYDLLKWKWSDLRSIDLKMSIPSIKTADVFQNPNLLASISHHDIYLFCSGPNQTMINISKRGDENVGLGFYDTARFLVELEEVLRQSRGGGGMHGGGKHLDNIILEVIYDVQVGKWMYSKIRYDKNEPNYIDSVLGVFIEQAEAISLEELEFTMIASVKKFEFDYETHLTKMKTNILDWQRKR